MVTNYEVDAFISSLRDEGAEVQGLIKNFLKVLDDAHNPDLAAARKRLRELMQRDAEIGKHQQVWPLLAPWLVEAPTPAKPSKPKGTVIKDIGVAPP
ncbi:MAG: hypothetical protein ACOYXR_04550 [Nitrospirota bacterium]